MIREYLKLARSFNAVLTGISPVMGAIAMGQGNFAILFLLFLVGFWGHTFGFVYNDIHDYKIDKSSKEIGDRPLVSGTISIGEAWVFAILAIVFAFIFAATICFLTGELYSFGVLLIAAGLVILYDLLSKRLPFTDSFVALGIFFLILYGASTTVPSLSMITPLTWIICALGMIQVFFMQIVTGAIKDIENDSIHGVWTLAIQLGVKMTDGQLSVSNRFKAVAYGIQILDLFIVFLPFFVIWDVTMLSTWQLTQWVLLAVIGITMIFISRSLLTMTFFNRGRARMLIGTHYLLNFTLVPVMLMHLYPTSAILILFPGLGFLSSNLVLHGTLLQPKTM